MLTSTTSKPKRTAPQLYDLLVIPGAEITQNHLRSKKNSHIVALNIREFITPISRQKKSSKTSAQGALSIACHPHHRTTRRVEIGTCYLWDHRKRLAELVDVWSRQPRRSLLVTSLKHYPYVANSDFHKPKHLYSWKTCCGATRTGTRSPDTAIECRRRATLYRNGSWAA